MMDMIEQARLEEKYYARAKPDALSVLLGDLADEIELLRRLKVDHGEQHRFEMALKDKCHAVEVERLRKLVLDQDALEVVFEAADRFTDWSTHEEQDEIKASIAKLRGDADDT